MKKLLVVAAGLAAVAQLCFAGVEAGKDELQVQGTLQNVSAGGFDSQMISAQVVYNRFIRDDISVGGALRVDMFDHGEDTSTSIFILGRGDYYFPALEDYVPYAGAHLGIANFDYGEFGSTEFTYGLQGGVKFFISENASVNAELDLSLYSGDGEDVTATSLLLGLSHYF